MIDRVAEAFYSDHKGGLHIEINDSVISTKGDRKTLEQYLTEHGLR
jgi:hypothetical protein